MSFVLIKVMIKQDNLLKSIYDTMRKHGKLHTIQHSKNVTDFAMRFSKQDKELEHKIKLACALHDISVIIPKAQWLDECYSCGITVCEEERVVPLLLHQKLSAHIAKTMFGVDHNEVLLAISCHTTLKAHASNLDLVLFVSDKMAWDGVGVPPWYDVVSKGLERSLLRGAHAYIHYLLNSNDILVVHPELESAYDWLKDGKIKI